MRETPKVIISGFADEGPEDKKAEAQLAMLATLGMSHYSLRFVDVGQGVKNVMQLTQPEITRLRQLHGEFGIAVASIGSPIGKVKLLEVEDGSANAYIPFDQYLQQDVQRAVDLAGEFETRLIRGFSFYHPQGENPANYLEPAAERLAQIAEVCSRGGTIFGSRGRGQSRRPERAAPTKALRDGGPPQPVPDFRRRQSIEPKLHPSRNPSRVSRDARGNRLDAHQGLQDRPGSPMGGRRR